MGVPQKAVGTSKVCKEGWSREEGACAWGLRSRPKEEGGTGRSLSPGTHAWLGWSHPGFY